MGSTMKAISPLVTPAVALLLLVGCNKQPAETPAAPTTDNPAEVSGQPANEVNQALSSTDIDLAMEVVGKPSYAAETDTVSFQLAVTNNGPVALATAGKYPVQLGLIIRDSNGKMDGAVAKQDFLRIPFPAALDPGQRVVMPVTFPAAPTIGGIVVVDGVQEGVSWFSSYDKPVLEVGQFQRCDGAAQSLCAADGTPVGAGH
jgi:hypothetical protein